MSYNMLQKLILFISAIGMSACASIPHATVELSTLLGKQIDALEQSHVATINAYYTEKEKTIIDFIDKTWYLLIPGDSRPPIPVILGHPC